MQLWKQASSIQRFLFSNFCIRGPNFSAEKRQKMTDEILMVNET